jgi:hypothetical protein
MAYQHADKKRQPGAQILRTPAPDEVTEIRHPKGGQGYGQNAPQPSSVAPGKAVESALGSNLRQSQVADTSEDVLSEVIAKGVAGRGDAIPADGDDDQLRNVSAEMYPVAAFGSMKRQQDPDFFKKKPSLPASTADSDEEPVRKP